MIKRSKKAQALLDDDGNLFKEQPMLSLDISDVLNHKPKAPVGVKSTVEVKREIGKPLSLADQRLLYDLAFIHCTKEEIGTLMGMSRDSIYMNPRYFSILQKGYEDGKKSLRRKMFEVAMSGNVTMLIWLSKQILGHKDKQPDEVPHTIIQVQVNEVP